MAAQSCGAHNGRAAPMRWFVHSGARSCGMHRLLQAFGLRTTMIGTRYSSTNPWIAKYIFPGVYVPALSEVLPAVERAGLLVTDIEILRLHYADTLKAWRQR